MQGLFQVLGSEFRGFLGVYKNQSIMSTNPRFVQVASSTVEAAYVDFQKQGPVVCWRWTDQMIGIVTKQVLDCGRSVFSEGFPPLCLRLCWESSRCYPSRVLSCMRYLLRNLGLQCLLTDVPDEWMRLEVVEEELGHNQKLRLCQKLLMRLTVVEEGGSEGGDPRGRLWRFLAYLSS
ncbi:hypothetical protein Tco_0796219 [Tanacetum coccineum]